RAGRGKACGRRGLARPSGVPASAPSSTGSAPGLSSRVGGWPALPAWPSPVSGSITRKETVVTCSSSSVALNSRSRPASTAAGRGSVSARARSAVRTLPMPAPAGSPLAIRVAAGARRPPVGQPEDVIPVPADLRAARQVLGVQREAGHVRQLVRQQAALQCHRGGVLLLVHLGPLHGER